MKIGIVKYIYYNVLFLCPFLINTEQDVSYIKLSFNPPILTSMALYYNTVQNAYHFCKYRTASSLLGLIFSLIIELAFGIILYLLFLFCVPALLLSLICFLLIGLTLRIWKLFVGFYNLLRPSNIIINISSHEFEDDFDSWVNSFNTDSYNYYVRKKYVITLICFLIELIGSVSFYFIWGYIYYK